MFPSGGVACVEGSEEASLPTERLEQEIVGLSAHLAAAMCRWLLLVAEYDRRAAYEAWECLTCAHWLSWRCGLTIATAREHVRVARRLVELPALREVFARGELSYSKVRALVRVADESTIDELIDLARTSSGAQLERIVALYARMLDARSDEVLADREERRGVDRSIDEHGMHVYVVRVPPEEGELVDRWLEFAQDKLYAAHKTASVSDAGSGSASAPAGARVPVAQRRADALLRLLEMGVRADAMPDVVPGENYHVLLHVDASATVDEEGSVHLGGGVVLHPSLAKRLGCDAMIQLARERSGESSLDLGRTVRTATAKQRLSLIAAYETCVFPGCHVPSRWCQAHHLVHWEHNGPTDMSNLRPLCRRHHHAVHEGGWRLVADAFGRMDAISSDGRYMAAAPLPPSLRDAPGALPKLSELSEEEVRPFDPGWDRSPLTEFGLAVIGDRFAALDPRLREGDDAVVRRC